jgi:hypothetical protein
MGYWRSGTFDNETVEIKVVKMEAKLNIYQRINAVQKEISYLQKDKKVDTGGGRSYFALTHDKLVGELRGLLVKHGIATIPRIVSEHLDRHVNQEGKVSYFTQVRVTIQMNNIDDKADFCTIEAIGYGIDTQDKGAGKALSYATKYALLKTFMIESGDDEEDRPIENLPQATSKIVGQVVKNETPKQKTQVTKNGEYIFPASFKKFAGQKITADNIFDVISYFDYLKKGAKNPDDPRLIELGDAIAKFNNPSAPLFTTDDVAF